MRTLSRTGTGLVQEAGNSALAFSPRLDQFVAAVPRSLPDWTVFLSTLWFGSYAYLYWYGIGGMKPLHSYFVLIGATGLWFLARLALLRAGFPARDRWVNAFFLWCAIYFGYALFTHAVLGMGYAEAEPLVIAAQFVAITSAFVLLMSSPRRLSLAMVAFVATAIAATILNIFDFLSPTFSAVVGRAAGLYVNPTISGNWIAMAMVAGLAAVPRRLRPVFVAFCGLGVLLTFSRESWLVWGVALVWIVRQGHLGGVRRSHLKTLMGVTIGGAILVFLFSGGFGQLIGESHVRAYLNENTLARLGISGDVLSGESVDERTFLVFHSLSEAAEAPVLGKGFGYTQNWGSIPRPHNMFLLFFVEGGIVGVGVFAALVLILWRGSGGLGRIVVGLFIVTSFFSHNNLEQPAMMLLIAFALAHGALARRHTTSSVVAGELALAYRASQLPVIATMRAVS
jgi:hypothetical protein